MNRQCNYKTIKRFKAIKSLKREQKKFKKQKSPTFNLEGGEQYGKHVL